MKQLHPLVGNTPLVELQGFDTGSARVLMKVESGNCGGSVKDRAALSMLQEAGKQGLLQPDSVIIEPTSGNTGIALAWLCAQKGYGCIIVMPDTMSKERQLAISAYGAQVVLTEGAKGMAGAIEKARLLAASLPHSFIPNQFENPANALAHYETTGPEIWRDTQGNVDLFVACVGTGGTVTGVGRYLKEQDPSVQIVAIEPTESPLLSGGKAGAHGIQGIGANFIPKVLDRSLLNGIVTVSTEEAYACTKKLAQTNGLLAGLSSGAAVCAAVKLAQQHPGKTIVTLLPDTGTRYFSTGVF